MAYGMGSANSSGRYPATGFYIAFAVFLGVCVSLFNQNLITRLGLTDFIWGLFIFVLPTISLVLALRGMFDSEARGISIITIFILVFSVYTFIFMSGWSPARMFT